MDERCISDEIESFLREGEPTVGQLVDTFEEKSFAILFVLLLGVPALPIPTGGITHVFEVITVLAAAQLVVGRDRIWLPERWRRLALAGAKRERFLQGLLKVIRWFERFSRPRLRHLFDHRLSNLVFGVAIIGLTAGAFLAPPFSGLDTLPALGGVIVALGVLLEDIVVVSVGLVIGVAGVALEVILGRAAVHGISKLVG